MTAPARARACALIVAPLLLATLSQADDTRVLSEAEIQAAIELGSTGSPEPYRLLWRMGREPYTAVASVYTPFLRVACWARLQQDRGPLRPHDVPRDLMAPVLIVAIPDEPRCCTPELASGPPLGVRAALACTIVQRGVNTDVERVMVSDVESHPALWTTIDVSFLRRFDPAVAARTSALAAFALDDIRPGYTIVLEQRFRERARSEVRQFITNGTLVDADVHAWR